MTPRVLLRPEARLDLRDARDWYERQSPGLGSEFLRAVESVIGTIQRAPAFYPLVEAPIRRAILRRFPYQVVYTEEAGDVVVLACLHHRRDPTVWRSRR